MKQKDKTKRLVQISMLSAIIVVLQLLGTLLTGFTGLPMSFVLIPIVVGTIVIGPNAGAILGGVFGLITMFMGLFGLDAFTGILMFNFGPWKMIVVILLCLVKAILAGYGAGWLYKLLMRLFKGKYVTLSTVLSSVSAPIVNTGIFIIGMLLFFFNDMGSIQLELAKLGGADVSGFIAQNSVKFIFLGLAGWNFVSEFIINLIISPAVVRVVDIVINKKKN